MVITTRREELSEEFFSTKHNHECFTEWLVAKYEALEAENERLKAERQLRACFRGGVVDETRRY